MERHEHHEHAHANSDRKRKKPPPKHVMREELGSGTSFIGVLILSERRR